MSRLVIVLLNPGQVFTNMKNIQTELNPIMQKIIPENCSNLPCPYLTDGDELGERLILQQNKDFIIEEYKSDDDNFYRRLILTRNLNQIQSQFKINYIVKDPMNPKKQINSLLPEKNGFDIGIDQGYLDFECHKLMIVGLALMEQSLVQEERRVLVLGGGLCALSSFLKQHFENFKLETVEINEEIIKIAEEMFEVKGDQQDFKIICDDAWAFVNKNVGNSIVIKEKIIKNEKEEIKNEKEEVKNEKEEKSEEKKIKNQETVIKHEEQEIKNENKAIKKQEKEIQNQEKATQNEKDERKNENEAIKYIKNQEEVRNNVEEIKENDNNVIKLYDLIIIDINSDDVNEMSPPEQFLIQPFLQNLQKSLNKNGMLFINFVNKDERNFEKVLKDISEVFHIVYSARIENEYNTVIYAKNLKYQIDKKKDGYNEEEKIMRVEENTIFDKKTIEMNFKNIIKNLKKPWENTLNLEGFLNSLILQSPNMNKNPFEKKSAHFLDVKENLTNNTKEMYIKDLEKVSKNKKKKKKNKMR